MKAKCGDQAARLASLRADVGLETGATCLLERVSWQFFSESAPALECCREPQCQAGGVSYHGKRREGSDFRKLRQLTVFAYKSKTVSHFFQK